MRYAENAGICDPCDHRCERVRLKRQRGLSIHPHARHSSLALALPTLTLTHTHCSTGLNMTSVPRPASHTRGETLTYSRLSVAFPSINKSFSCVVLRSVCVCVLVCVCVCACVRGRERESVCVCVCVCWGVGVDTMCQQGHSTLVY